MNTLHGNATQEIIETSQRDAAAKLREAMAILSDARGKVLTNSTNEALRINQSAMTHSYRMISEIAEVSVQLQK